MAAEEKGLDAIVYGVAIKDVNKFVILGERWSYVLPLSGAEISPDLDLEIIA